MLCDANRCTGCGACRNACPKNAIAMAENEHGFLLPKIETERCVGCNLCTKACPVVNPIQPHDQPRCLVAWSADEQLRKTAASAGVISALAQRTIRDGGVVFGTCYHDGRLVFDYIQDETQIPRFQGSKYVHADVGEAYRQVRSFLKEGRLVLFPGTPCQIAGLKKYLGREYDQLLTVDLICHGVTSEKYLQDYLHSRKKGLRYDRVLFRGEQGEKLVAYRGHEAVWTERKLESPFYMAYAKGLIHRENCYHCPFASVNRCADLTAGDFWGISRKDLPEGAASVPYPGLVLVHTTKGADALARADIRCEEQKLELALPGNKQLSTPCVRHPDRDVFMRLYMEKGFYRALKKTLFFRRVQSDGRKYRILRFLSKIKHRILR